jgi:hypothetical protein
MHDFIHQHPVTNSLSETKGTYTGNFAGDHRSRKVKNRENIAKFLH